MSRLLRVLLVCGVCLAVAGPAAPAEKDKPAPPPAAGKNYDLRTARVGNTLQAVRFKPATGQTWQLGAGGWEKIPETGKVPPGDYEVVLVATDTDFTALRFDRTTGATWHLKGRKWVAVPEPK